MEGESRAPRGTYRFMERAQNLIKMPQPFKLCDHRAHTNGSQTVVRVPTVALRLFQVVLKVIYILDFICFHERFFYFHFSNASKV